jgi:hypothetical protein
VKTLGLVIKVTLWQLGTLFLLPAVLAVILFFQQLFIVQRLAGVLGIKGAVFWTGWLGTPIHETSHAAFALLFGHKIIDIDFFSLNDDVLGYVHHSYDPSSLYQQIGNFFIGVAPLIGGSAVMFLLLVVLFPGEAWKKYLARTEALFHEMKPKKSGAGFINLLTLVSDVLFDWKNLRKVRFWIFIYVGTCIGAHISPSPQDLEGALQGFLFMLGLLLLINLTAVIFHGDLTKIIKFMAKIASPLVGMLILAVLLNILNLGVIYLATWPFLGR